MKRMLPWMSLILLILLTACSIGAGAQEPGGPTPNLSDSDAATQVAVLLTQMATQAAPTEPAATPTVTLPTLPVEAPSQTPANDAEPAPVEVTATPGEPTAAPAEPTSLPTETAAPSEPTAAPTQPLPTATLLPDPAFTPPAGDPRQRLGAPTSTDPMNNDSIWIWPMGADSFTKGAFNDGSMVVTALSDTDGWRIANPRGREFNNLYLEATMRTGTCAGSDHYGLITRVPDNHEPDQGYLFSFTCDGRYSLRRWDGEAGEKGEMSWLINWTSSSAIASGSNQTNRISLFTSGSRLILYANGVLLAEVRDAVYPSGYFGVLAGADQTDNLTIYVDEMSYWDNPQP